MIEIEKENYAGESAELTPADTPFSVDIDDEEFVYTPLRFSTATIRIAGSDYLQSLFSTSYREYRVTLKRSGEIVWCGFIKPELYTQDYVYKTFVLEIECISAMSVLEFIDYKKAGEGMDFVNLWDLLKKCISESNGQYNGVYIPHVYAIDEASYNANSNPIEGMSISEQDFFDEDDKAMTLKEVLENLCKFFNWTCVDWRGDLYFVDIDHTGDYHYYDITLTTKTNVSQNEKNVQQVGFSGSDHTLDILPGYNKVTVKDSNYSVGEVFPQEDTDKLTRLGDKITYAREYVVDNKVSRKIYFLPGVYKMYHYENGTVQNEVSEETIKNMSLDDVELLLGAIPIKRCNYEMENIGGTWQPNITSYSYEDLIQLRITKYPAVKPVEPASRYDYDLKDTKPLLTFAANLPSTVYKDGAFAIQGSVQMVKAMSSNISDYTPIDEMYSFGDELPSISAPYFVCELSVGNKYWNGTQFTDIYSTFNVLLTDGKDETFSSPVSGGFLNIKSTKTLAMPYDGLEGYVIPIGETLIGQLRFIIKGFKAYMLNGSMNCFLKDLKCVYQKVDGYGEDDNTDRTYENVVNEDYINEADDIEFKVTSYNDDGACYSKVIMNNEYLSTIWNKLTETEKRPEELLITRIVNRYKSPKIKLTQVIKESIDIVPFTSMSDNYQVNKRFINAGGTIDYKMNRFNCIMIEL
ncbi:MAG: hypothetical protein LKI39_02710 [Bacteroides sp.]|nr:hypothetical protein [Bacteroides sp.]